MHSFLTGVESVSLRDVQAGQIELAIKTRGGEVVIRLIGKKEGIRVTDLRARDKKKRRKTAFVSVPFEEIIKQKEQA